MQHDKKRSLTSLFCLWASIQIPRFSIPVYIGASTLPSDFGLSASSAGLLAAIYFPVYAAMQIPGGLLSDRIHCVRLLRISTLGLIVSTIGLAFSRTLITAMVIKAFSGLIDGLAWQAMLKQLAETYKENHTRAVSILVTGQGIGQIIGLIGLPVLLGWFSWRETTLLMLLPLIGSSLALWAYNSSYPRTHEPDRKHLFSGIYMALKNKYFWPIVLIAGFWNGGQFGFLAWLPSFTNDILGYSTVITGVIPGLMSLGVVIGSLLVSRYVQDRKKTMVFVLGAITTCFLQLTFVLAGNSIPSILWTSSFLLGGLFAIYFLSVPIITGYVPASQAGAAIGTMNTLNFLPAFLLPWLMGVVLESQSNNTFADGALNKDAYLMAFLLPCIFLGISLIGSVLYILTRKKSNSSR